MTPEETLTRVAEYPDFHRLASGLKNIVIDFDYKATRKALEPNWNGYNMPKGHDIITDDVGLHEANLVTSQVKGTDLHRIVLDLDYGAEVRMTTPVGKVLKLNLTSGNILFTTCPDIMNTHLLDVLNQCWIPKMPPLLRRYQHCLPADPPILGALEILTDRDLSLTPSTTPGHKHLIMNVDQTWEQYADLLDTFAGWGIIEPGYAKASISKGYSSIRPPWVRK